MLTHSLAILKRPSQACLPFLSPKAPLKPVAVGRQARPSIQRSDGNVRMAIRLSRPDYFLPGSLFFYPVVTSNPAATDPSLSFFTSSRARGPMVQWKELVRKWIEDARREGCKDACLWVTSLLTQFSWKILISAPNEAHFLFFVCTEMGSFSFIKAVVYVHVSRAPAALPESESGLICHKSAGTNYQQALSDRTPNNRDNPGIIMKPPAGFRDSTSRYPTLTKHCATLSFPPRTSQSCCLNITSSPRCTHVCTPCTSVSNPSPRQSAMWPTH